MASLRKIPLFLSVEPFYFILHEKIYIKSANNWHKTIVCPQPEENSASCAKNEANRTSGGSGGLMEEMNALLARRWGETHTTQLKLSFCPDQLWLRWLTGHCRVAPPTVPSVYIQTSNVFWLAVIESRWSCTLHITPGLDRVLQFILPSKPHTLFISHRRRKAADEKRDGESQNVRFFLIDWNVNVGLF